MCPTDITVYADAPTYPSIQEGLDRLADADQIIMHNGMMFDLPAIEHLYPNSTLRKEQIIDTLIYSRLQHPQRGGHGLAKWGERLGFPKGDYSDWSVFTKEMGEYCATDVSVTIKVFEFLEQERKGADILKAYNLERDFAYVMGIQERHGFKLDVPACEELAAEMRQKMSDIEVKLQEVFPPLTIERVSEKTGKRLKDKIEIFNPGSRKQIAERLVTMYEWTPTKFTPAGSPQIDETVLKQLKYPEAQLLAEYFLYQKQLSQISEGEAGWLKKVTDKGYVHGSVNPIGTTTNRCSHFGPNMAQISKRDLRMREVWKPDLGDKLVGIDADALELRMLAHYLGHFDDGAYTTALLEGKKEEGTDVHSRTGKLIELEDRDVVKRATYAYLYGASDRKLSQIMREADAPCKNGKEIRRRMNEGIVGLGKLSDLIKKRAERGYILGIDGRQIKILSPHSALNFLLQSAGSILMKKALVIFHYDLCERDGHVVEELPVTFNYCANVHDEVQLSCRPQHAEAIGKLFAKAIKLAGEQLGLNCPTSGSYDIGDSWRETH
jgi:DNA polymerase-1